MLFSYTACSLLQKHPTAVPPTPIPIPATATGVGTIDVEVDEFEEPVVPAQPDPVEALQQPEPEQPQPEQQEPAETDGRGSRIRQPVTCLHMTHMGPVDAHISSLLDVPTDKSPAEIKI